MLSCGDIQCVCQSIINKFSPQKIILFNFKRSVSGDPRSFKICVILPTENKGETERRIYLDVESDIPYDVLIYTPSEWSELSKDKGSFAHSIREKGTVIYEQAP